MVFIGEESAGQIYDRAVRLGFGNLESLLIMTETKVKVHQLESSLCPTPLPRESLKRLQSCNHRP